MRLAELSEQSGVPTATIKFYLREKLLPPGRRVSATQAEYDESHLRRLRLIRALIQVGKLPVATARGVLAAADDESLPVHDRIGAALIGLPHGPQPDEDDPGLPEAERTVQTLLERLGWSYGRTVGTDYAAYRMVTGAVATLARLGYPCDVDRLLPYAQAAASVAKSDLDLVESREGTEPRIEAAVVGTVLYGPVLLGLRWLADAEESKKRFGA